MRYLINEKRSIKSAKGADKKKEKIRCEKTGRNFQGGENQKRENQGKENLEINFREEIARGIENVWIWIFLM